jgi:hypothetical protein
LFARKYFIAVYNIKKKNPGTEAATCALIKSTETAEIRYT